MGINKSNDNLSELIFSLNRQEKRYISIYLDQFKKGNNLYFKTFNLVSKKAKNVPNTINPVIKNQLYWKILRGLQMFNSENNAIIQKNNLLSQSHILNNKGLKTQALKVLKKANNICMKNDLNEDILSISNKEANLIIDKNESRAQENSISNYNKINLLNLKIINQNYALNKIFLQNKLNSNFFNLNLDPISHKILNAYVLKVKENEILSNYGNIIYNYNLGFYYLNINRIESALYHFKKAYTKFLSFNNLIPIHKEDFCDLLKLIFDGYLKLKKQKLSLTLFDKTKTELIKANTFDDEIKIIFIVSKINLLWIKNEIIENEINQLYILKEKTYNIKYLIEIDYQIIKYNFYFHKHRNLIRLANFFSNSYPNNYRPDLQLSIKILNIITVFLFKDFIHLKNELKTTRNYKLKQNIKSDFADTIIKDLHKYLKKENGLSPTKSIKYSFINNLQNTLKLSDYKLNFGIYFDFHIFVKTYTK